MMRFVMLMPRSSGGGAPVMVVRRPPSTSVASASASPPPAAFAAAEMPDELAAWPCQACPLGVVIVDDDVRAEGLHPRQYSSAGGGTEMTRRDGRAPGCDRRMGVIHVCVHACADEFACPCRSWV